MSLKNVSKHREVIKKRVSYIVIYKNHTLVVVRSRPLDGSAVTRGNYRKYVKVGGH